MIKVFCLYITDHILQDVMQKSAKQIQKYCPYDIYRFYPGLPATVGH